MQSDIKGIIKGSKGHFTITELPIGGSLSAGTVPVWRVNTNDVTVVASADGLSADIFVPVNEQATNGTLIVTGVDLNGNPVTTVLSVPFLQGFSASSFDIKQV